MSIKYNIHPSKWKTIENLRKYHYDKWILFSDRSKHLFIIVWEYIEKNDNLILNEDCTAFKKVRWCNKKEVLNNIFS